jgi:hypothetical protein
MERTLRGIAFVAVFLFAASPSVIAEDQPQQSLKATRELKNRGVAAPADFRASCRLDALPATAAPGAWSGIRKAGSATGTAVPTLTADVAVNILGPNFHPVKTYVLRNRTSVDTSSRSGTAGIHTAGRCPPVPMSRSFPSCTQTTGKRPSVSGSKRSNL